MAKTRRLNQELVVTKAAYLANEAGTTEGLTLTQLAQALDERVPSLYNHVKGIAGLQRELTLLGSRQLLAQVREASYGKVGRDALLAMAYAYRCFAHEQPGIYPLTIRAPEPDDAELSALTNEWLQLLLLVMASFNLKGDDAYHAIRGFRALVHGFVSLETAVGFKLPLDKDESYTRLVTTFLDGLT